MTYIHLTCLHCICKPIIILSYIFTLYTFECGHKRNNRTSYYYVTSGKKMFLIVYYGIFTIFIVMTLKKLNCLDVKSLDFKITLFNLLLEFGATSTPYLLLSTSIWKEKFIVCSNNLLEQCMEMNRPYFTNSDAKKLYKICKYLALLWISTLSFLIILFIIEKVLRTDHDLAVRIHGAVCVYIYELTVIMVLSQIIAYKITHNKHKEYIFDLLKSETCTINDVQIFSRCNTYFYKNFLLVLKYCQNLIVFGLLILVSLFIIICAVALDILYFKVNVNQDQFYDIIIMSVYACITIPTSYYLIFFLGGLQDKVVTLKQLHKFEIIFRQISDR